MLKKLIAPLQKILLQKGICPGCSTPLRKITVREPKTQTTEKVICKCGRAFIYDKELKTYRRALEEEV